MFIVDVHLCVNPNRALLGNSSTIVLKILLNILDVTLHTVAYRIPSAKLFADWSSLEKLPFYKCLVRLSIVLRLRSLSASASLLRARRVHADLV